MAKERWIAVVGILAALLALAPAAWAQAPERRDPNQDILSVSGMGEVRIVPDRAVVSLGVEARAAQAGEAIQENNRVMQRVVEAIRKLGIPERSIQTAQLNVSRQYEPTAPESRTPPRPIYVVTNVVTVRLEDPARTGAVVDAATTSGANVVHGISFVSERDEEARLQALTAAVRDARGKADAIAQALSVRIAGVESVSESSGPVPPPQPFMGDVAMARVEAGAPVLPGENVIRASVFIRYRLAR